MTKKKEEVVIEQEVTEDTAVSKKEEVQDADNQSVAKYIRSTPFGFEVWDPETKTTTMKSNG